MVNNTFAALAHPVRLGIVERLATGPRTVGDATTRLAASKPAISRHLRVLEDAGVIIRTVHGRNHHLQLNVATLNDTVDWLDRQRAVWDRLFDAVDNHLAAHAPTGSAAKAASRRGRP